VQARRPGPQQLVDAPLGVDHRPFEAVHLGAHLGEEPNQLGPARSCLRLARLPAFVELSGLLRTGFGALPFNLGQKGGRRGARPAEVALGRGHGQVLQVDLAGQHAVGPRAEQLGQRAAELAGVELPVLGIGARNA
jgi:hypothetical protein